MAGRAVRKLRGSQLFFCSLAESKSCQSSWLQMSYSAFLKAVVMIMQQSQSCFIISYPYHQLFNNQ